MKVLDANHAVMLLREHVRNHTPEGQSIITKFEKGKEWGFKT